MAVRIRTHIKFKIFIKYRDSYQICKKMISTILKKRLDKRDYKAMRNSVPSRASGTDQGWFSSSNEV